MENVYKKTYTQEFIDQLPIKWEYWSNVDLSKVPDDFKCLYTTDWNWGPYSSMPMDLRIIYHEMFLEYHNLYRGHSPVNKPILSEEDLEKEKM